MKRVMITGLGALTPIGNSVYEFWNNALNGCSGAATTTRFNPSGFKTTFACELKNFDPGKYLSHSEIKKVISSHSMPCIPLQKRLLIAG